MATSRHYLRRLLTAPVSVLWSGLRGQYSDAAAAAMDGALAAGYLAERTRNQWAAGSTDAKSRVRTDPARAAANRSSALVAQGDDSKMGRAR